MLEWASSPSARHPRRRAVGWRRLVRTLSESSRFDAGETDGPVEIMIGARIPKPQSEFEIGSSVFSTAAAWAWRMDTVIPVRSFETEGEGRDRRDCMRQFRAAWDRFAADEANLTEFLNAKRGRR